MTYSEKVRCSMKIDDELLTPCELKKLRNAVDAFIKYLTVVTCPGYIFNGAPCPPEICDFHCKCDRCWNQEA